MKCVTTAVCGLVVGGMILALPVGFLDRTLSAAGAQQVAEGQPQAAEGRWRPQFPRPGATKILETDDVLVWDDIHTTYDHWHKHIFDGVMIWVQNGPWTEVSCHGANCEEFETRFNTVEGNVVSMGGDATPHPLQILGRHSYVGRGLGPHTEASMQYAAPRRAIFVEVKKSLAPDAAEWSTDPTGETDKNWPVIAAPKPPMLPTIHATQKKWPSLAEAMMTAGVKKTIDNDHVTVWDETLRRTEPILHKNVRNVIAVDLWDAPVKLYNGDTGAAVDVPAGLNQAPHYKRRMPSVYELKAGTGPYDAVAVEPDTATPRRTLWIEIKGTEAPDCKAWSSSCN